MCLFDDREQVSVLVMLCSTKALCNAAVFNEDTFTPEWAAAATAVNTKANAE